VTNRPETIAGLQPVTGDLGSMRNQVFYYEWPASQLPEVCHSSDGGVSPCHCLTDLLLVALPQLRPHRLVVGLHLHMCIIVITTVFVTDVSIIITITIIITNINIIITTFTLPHHHHQHHHNPPTSHLRELMLEPLGLVGQGVLPLEHLLQLRLLLL
jgi:hypothetical protein